MISIVVALRRSGVTGHLAGLKLRAVDLTLPLHVLPLLAYAWVAVSGRERPRERLAPRDWLLVLGPATLVMYLLTLTPTLTVRGRPRGVALFHWVYTYVPGAAAFRAPGRWALVYALPLALVAGVALAALTARLPRRARAAVRALVLLIVMLECLPLPIPWQRRPPVPPAHRWLAQQPGDFAVAVLPATDSRHAAWAMLWATTHWKRLVNGAFVFVPPTVHTLAAQESDGTALVSTLRSIYPLRYALVDRSALSAAEAAAWTRIDHDPRGGITFVGRFGRDDVFGVEGTPQEAPVVRRWFSTDYVGRHPRAEYALGLTGADPDTRRRVEVRFNERLLATQDGPGRVTVDLAPPYQTGDRNELTFTHRYDLDTAAGAIVIALVRDEGTANLSPDAVRALGSIGARADVSRRFHAAHAVIGVKGATPGDVIERSGSEPVRVAVGRARPLALVLEAFELR
jgi:hypothetical protein